MVISRFAPSPTGALHLGHAFSAVRAHDRARAAGGGFLLRIEDIDGGRSRPDHVARIFDDLRWLGLAWDGDVLFQSERLDAYAEALERLKTMGLVYRCFCTRAEIAASLSAPHGSEGAIYPGTCRLLTPEEAERRAGEPHCWRLDIGKAIATVVTSDLFRGPPGRLAQEARQERSRGRADHVARWVPEQVQHDGELIWYDELAGEIVADPQLQGDVVLARKDAPASYHLAVTVDDAAQGVTHVVRGVDLFEATHIHRLLQALLDLPTPIYRHHALLTDAAGQRLAKRHGAPTLESLRLSGMGGPALADDLRAGRLPIGFGMAKA
jgi:glutamyl-Q tRNA(Asp) synthetase